MRFHHLIAIAAVLVLVSGVKLFFSGPTAQAQVDTVKSATTDILALHANARLPLEKFYDLTFVFAETD